jgi:hypothetical protein
MKRRQPGAQVVDAVQLVASPALAFMAEDMADYSRRGYVLRPNAQVFPRRGGATVRLVFRDRTEGATITLVIRL